MFQPSFMAMSSGDLATDRHFEWARDCQARGDIPAAIDLLRQMLELAPDYAAAWFALASLFEKQGDAVGEFSDREMRPPSAPAVLDLGCGIGLAGARFRPVAGHLCGVDLSAGMVAQAHRKAIYDRLHVGGLLGFLEADGAVGNRYHLVIAADVFVYVADLAPVFSAVARVLAAGALFAFTLEAGIAETPILKDSLRLAHGHSYVAATLSAAGLALLPMREITLRTEKGEPVPGLLVVARHN